MASIGEVTNFIDEIAFLESMFGGTVSAAVIDSVLESCGGNVHLAADAIMNFSNELSIPSHEATESIDVRPVQVTSVLNVDAQPFEFRQPQTTTPQPSLTANQDSGTFEVPKNERQDLPTILDSSTNANQQFKTAQQNSPTANTETTTKKQSLPATASKQSSTSASQQPSTFARHPTTLNQQPPYTAGPLSKAETRSVSFSEAFRKSGAVPKKPPDCKTQKPRYTIKNVWHDQVGKVLHYHNQGTRTLIIMRGVSGSGKSYLAKHIVDYTIGPSSQNYSKHIFSSDNYFIKRGIYQYNRDSLDEAHATNQRKVCEATNRGVSPVIVDNTNTELWEMEPYIRDGVRNGYMIEFVEPNTPWARNPSQLERRNSHGVPRDKIRRMLDRYEKGITAETAMKTLKLTYSPNRLPPVLRNIPLFSSPESPRESPKRVNDNNHASNSSQMQITCEESNKMINIKNDNNHASNASNIEFTREESFVCSGEQPSVTMNHVTETKKSPDNVDRMLDDEHDVKLKKIIEAQRNIEHFEKIELEWENGESWDTKTEENKASAQNSAGSIGSVSLDPKPPREADSKNIGNFIETSRICDDDWTKFMPPWEDSSITNSGAVETPVQVESTSIGTGFEVDDMNEYMHSVRYGIPRDINEATPERHRSKIPKAIMLDKSTSTHDNDFLSKKEVCKNKEHHFKELRRMFKTVPRLALRDIFESCNCDVNWAVNLVLDCYPESQENENSDVIISDDEDEGPVDECNCLAGYNIVPDMVAAVEITSPQEPESFPQNSHVVQKKPKREVKLSDNSLQLKRQIESNVMISDNHYSQHYLNLRRRRDNIDGPERANAIVSNNSNTDVTESNTPRLEMDENDTALPDATQNAGKYPTDFRDVAGPSTAHYDLQFLDADPIDSDTESDSNKSDNLETTVTINLGREFLEKLDELFGRKYFQYPENIQPVVNLPLSILRQINAHWAMSVAAQLDDGSRQSEAMIKQDEDFARQLADKEQKMTEEGKEPEIPTFKEIMEMEQAYSAYERSIAKWRSKEPQDLAAKLSRKKLFNLFPDLSEEVLSEMLMAHDYKFKATIESLIISTGQSHWLEDEKGVEKFVIHKEMVRKEKFLEEQKKTLDEAEWPYLTSNPERPVTLETVNYYRDEAEKWLQCRNANFEKARQYIAKNNPSIASFYSDIAAFHTRKYEQTSGLAAAYLMNYHLINNPDKDVLDLHFLRVPEAMVNLDLFIDQVIFNLRDKNIRFKIIWIITGKGIHSVGGPRIKPAAIRRLKARKITGKLANGGLVVAEIYPTHKMTAELTDNNV